MKTMHRFPRPDYTCLSPAGPLLFLVVLLVALGESPARAETALSVNAGSLGLGVELTQSFSPYLDGRVGFHGGNLTERRRLVADVDYDATAKARTGTALLDWHPAATGFRLTGGVVYNGSRVDALSRIPDSGVYRIGGVNLPAAQVGRLRGRADFKTFAPYVGLGWGGPLASHSRLGFTFDLGAFYQGAPNVTLTPVLPAGSPLDNPVGRALLAVAVAEEERRAEKDLSSYKYYPVLSLGLSYRF
jgi:hypothetical protein